jgi:hypothetical protein
MALKLLAPIPNGQLFELVGTTRLHAFSYLECEYQSEEGICYYLETSRAQFISDELDLAARRDDLQPAFYHEWIDSLYDRIDEGAAE